jgi:hypothetical protein
MNKSNVVLVNIVCKLLQKIPNPFRVHNNDRVLLADILSAIVESSAVKIFEQYSGYYGGRIHDKHDTLLLYLEHSTFTFCNKKYEKALYEFRYDFAELMNYIVKCDAQIIAW